MLYRLSMVCVLTTAALSAILVAPRSALALEARRDRIDFNRDVRPIITDKCFACHGPDAKHAKGGLRLDIAESAYEKKKSGDTAIVPGKPDESSLIARIMTTDADDLMPPPDSHKSLSEGEKATLRKWIAEGGSYEKPWAYVPPVNAPDPTVKRADWPINFIDRFILARLEAEGLAPAPDADRVTLIRRLSFDLTGLPPTPAEVDAFVADTSADAYEKLVDRLLASPHFGERMAIGWLDLVRYADTVGYHGDQDQNAWPYRNYVIKAFNANLPFDRFIREQLAGDLLPSPTQDQRVATCYNRLLQTTHEGGAQLKEYRAIYMADRVRNFSQVFMGATVGCAQCHNHKYDPYTAEDFHTLGAFFADVDDEEHLRNQYGGLNTLPTRRLPQMRVYDDEQLVRIKQIEAQLAKLDADIEAARNAVAESLDARLGELRRTAAEQKPVDEVWHDDESKIGGTIEGLADSLPNPPAPVDPEPNAPADPAKSAPAAIDPPAPHSGQTVRVQSAAGLTQHVLRQAQQPPVIAAGDTLYAWVYLDPQNPPNAIMLQYRTGDDWNHRAYWGKSVIPYGKSDKPTPAYRRIGDLPQTGAWVRLEVDAAAIGLTPGMPIVEVAWTQHGGRVRWDDTGVVRVGPLPLPIVAALTKPADQFNDGDRKNLIKHLESIDPELERMTKERPPLVAERAAIERAAPVVMVTEALAEPRPVHVLPRGNWLDESGPLVTPAIPAFMGKLDTPSPDGSAEPRRATRLDLADWLVRPDAKGGVGGLTARVQVNRFWARLMGVGIARVLDDFGGQGEPPVHPELLDRLAIAFVDSGWDVKATLKLIVMSRTYRQSSVTPAALAERDPDNRLYAHQARPRLPAELVRDNALAISGLLVDDQIGGPSVKPYQPARYYAHLNFPTREYRADNDRRQWRRGVYMHWQRQFLHPMLKAFDAQTREECVAGRPQSNIPTQALTLLNDPTFVEASRVFAARVLAVGGATDGERIAYAFTLATSRKPEPREAALLADLLAKHREHFKHNPAEAAKLLKIGLTPAPAGIEPAELAAWSSVTRTLLNLNETITRN